MVAQFFGTTALENVLFVEEIAYGDPGLYLSLPGPNLSGTIVEKLGTQKAKRMNSLDILSTKQHGQPLP